MPDRIVRDELLESDRWLELKRNTHRLAFVCLLLECDALGNLEATTGRLWRLWREPLGLPDRSAIAEILEALVSADLIRIYASDDGRGGSNGKRYAHIPRTRFRLRWLTRIHPLSPWTTDEQKQKVVNNPPGEIPAQAGLKPAKKGNEGEGRGEKGKEENPLGANPAKTAELRAVAVRVIERLNRLSAKRFKPAGPNLELIIARLREGYTERDLRVVIALKCQEWLPDEKMAKHVVPKTLFNRTNFASYAGSVPAEFKEPADDLVP